MSHKHFMATEMKRVELIMRQLMEGLVLRENAPLKLVGSAAGLEILDSNYFGREVEPTILIASDKQVYVVRRDCSGNDVKNDILFTTDILHSFKSQDYCRAIKLINLDSVVYGLAASEKYVIIKNIQERKESKVVTVLSHDDSNNGMKINMLDVCDGSGKGVNGKLIVSCHGKGVFAISLDELLTIDHISLNDGYLMYTSKKEGKPLRVAAGEKLIYISEGNILSVFNKSSFLLEEKYNNPESITALAVTLDGKICFGTEYGSLYRDFTKIDEFKSRSSIQKIDFLVEDGVEKMLLMVQGVNEHFVWKKQDGKYVIASPHGWDGKFVDFAAAGNVVYSLGKNNLYSVHQTDSTQILSLSDRLRYIDILGGT